MNLKGKKVVPDWTPFVQVLKLCTKMLLVLAIPASGGAAADELGASSSQPEAFQ